MTNKDKVSVNLGTTDDSSENIIRIILDEEFLADHLLSPDSQIRKQRQNKELSALNEVASLIKLIDFINTLIQQLATANSAKDKLYVEELRHAREIENFFKNLALIDQNSNLKIQLMNAQLDQLRSGIEKLDNAIKKLDESINILNEKIAKAEAELAIKKQKLDKSFKEIMALFDKCLSSINAENYTPIKIDLSKLTSDSSLKEFTIDVKEFKEIINEVKSICDEKNANNETFKCDETIINVLNRHVLTNIQHQSGNPNFNSKHAIIQQAASEIANQFDASIENKMSEKFNSYHKLMSEITADERKLSGLKDEKTVEEQRRDALTEGKDLSTSMLDDGKADLSVLKQLNSSLDSLIGDVLEMQFANQPKHDAPSPAPAEPPSPRRPSH